MDQRPDPDKLLKQVQADEVASHLGRLKLFFGASPGVGKTYAMLEAARQRKKEGWDVVIGLVETHGRVETEALLEGHEILPRKELSYKGVVLKEFDLDAALARRPKLLIVDELAHTNADGMRHAKRWQDIEELLDAGIDVYTTLNVQHWESLNDVVAQVTGVVIRETVPDTFLQRAHDLELVDLSPEDLLKRLQEGKVYRAEMAGRAADNFFQPGNLIALRELALRHTAERVDEQMQAFKERHAIHDVWSVNERLLVGVSSSPVSARLIRSTSRLATRLHARWLAVHVETPAYLRLPIEERNRAIENLRLAEKLGAEVVTLSGENVTDELLRFARSRNVTRIVLGKPARPRWKEWFFGSIINDIARNAGNIDLHVISGTDSVAAPRKYTSPETSSQWEGAGRAAAVVALCTLICWPLFQGFDRVNLVMIYLLGVMWTAYRFGRRVSSLAAVLSVACFDFFFVPPYLTFAVSDTEYLITFVIMLIVGLLISTITGRLRQQTLTLRGREMRMRALYKLSRDLSETPEKRQMLGTATHQLEEFYKCPILILTAGLDGNLEVSAGDAATFGWNENELSVARWVFDKSQMAGAGSDTLSGASGLYLPLKGLRSTVGVLGIRPSKIDGKSDAKSLLSPEQLQLLETFASEIGGALESTRMSEEIGRAELQIELQAMKQGTSERRIRIGDYLSEKQVVILPRGTSKDHVLRELLSRLSLPNHAQALQTMLERERAGATMISDAIAVPHARIPGIKGLQLALGIDRDGPVRLWLAFLSPAEDPRLHLEFLAALAMCFQDPARVDSILALNSPSEILDFIKNIS